MILSRSGISQQPNSLYIILEAWPSFISREEEEEEEEEEQREGACILAFCRQTITVA